MGHSRAEPPLGPGSPVLSTGVNYEMDGGIGLSSVRTRGNNFNRTSRITDNIMKMSMFTATCSECTLSFLLASVAPASTACRISAGENSTLLHLGDPGAGPTTRACIRSVTEMCV